MEMGETQQKAVDSGRKDLWRTYFVVPRHHARYDMESTLQIWATGARYQ